jgi:hypothetical protein
MWIFTKDGFFSAVENRDDNSMVLVRARTEDDARQLAEILANLVIESPNADYPYRIHCSKMEWADYVQRSALEIDYDNFKGAMSGIFGSNRMHQLHQVWAVMQSGEERYR